MSKLFNTFFVYLNIHITYTINQNLSAQIALEVHTDKIMTHYFHLIKILFYVYCLALIKLDGTNKPIKVITL